MKEWFYPQYQYRGTQPDGIEFYTNNWPQKLEASWNLSGDTIITEKIESNHNWLKIEEATPRDKGMFFSSQITAKVVTQHKATTIKIPCIVTANLEVFISGDHRGFPNLNVTHGTYYKAQGLDIEVNEPAIDAIRWALRGEYYVRKASLVGYGTVAVSEGLLLKETHLFKIEGKKLRPLGSNAFVDNGRILQF
jgi:hypothetical protein